jgi:hypothetical protein
MPSSSGLVTRPALSGDMKIGSTPSATSPATLSPIGVIEAA